MRKSSVRHLLSLADLSASELKALLRQALHFKRERPGPRLQGRVLALIFQKPSMRTRLSFTVAAHELGMETVYFSDAEVGLGQREPIADVARVLSRSVHAIGARTFRHEDIEELARWSSAPVINALSEREHPTQALADLLTLYERSNSLEGFPLAYVGDGNNVAHSLILGAALTGMELRVATPPGYRPLEAIWQSAEAIASQSGARLRWTADPREAVAGAAAVYTDVWTSMGQESEREQRWRDFQGYTVTSELFALARPDALFLHDMPIHRGEEVTDEVVESPRSVIFDQAENKVYAVMALLTWLLSESRS